jgi:hypothetical protein
MKFAEMTDYELMALRPEEMTKSETLAASEELRTRGVRLLKHADALWSERHKQTIKKRRRRGAERT